MRFGLVGAGEIGRIRADALTRSVGAGFVAVADTDTARATFVADRHQASAVCHFRELLTRDDLDAIIVSTPPNSHEELALAAIEAGKHVICEKPLAPTLDACRRMVAASKRHGRVLATGFCQRYFPAVRFAKNTVDSGAIGELTHVRAYTGHEGLPEFRKPWMYSKSTVGGGALMDNGIHVIDLVAHLLGDISEVYGAASHRTWKLDDVEDHAVALLRNSAGKTATIEAAWNEWRGYRFSIEAYGDRGMVRASYAPMFAMAVYLDNPGVVRRRKYYLYPRAFLREQWYGWQSTVRAAFIEEFRDFLRLTQGESSSCADGKAGLRAVEIAQAVYQSNAERRPVAIGADGLARCWNGYGSRVGGIRGCCFLLALYLFVPVAFRTSLIPGVRAVIRALLQGAIYISSGRSRWCVSVVKGVRILIGKFLWRVRRRMAAVYLFVGLYSAHSGRNAGGVGHGAVVWALGGVHGDIEGRTAGTAELHAAAASFGWEIRATEAVAAARSRPALSFRTPKNGSRGSCCGSRQSEGAVAGFPAVAA